jgi:hypothetical protein
MLYYSIICIVIIIRKYKHISILTYWTDIVVALKKTYKKIEGRFFLRQI